jgi:hypothetical protein
MADTERVPANFELFQTLIIDSPLDSFRQTFRDKEEEIRGDGIPLPQPLDGKISLVRFPSTWIQNLIVAMQAMIHLTHFSWKPTFRSKPSRKVQSTLS